MLANSTPLLDHANSHGDLVLYTNKLFNIFAHFLVFIFPQQLFQYFVIRIACSLRNYLPCIKQHHLYCRRKGLCNRMLQRLFARQRRWKSVLR
ncbi:hypothetical protein EJ08DRAFT_6505 [Tothia fuscella]|uniref:Uncharacterized protein n=1 Tax=Tothia fuscella TaxID=1048955 RepID=A0A9P4P541_9PEZI|nr:hypothetical protein EJ08DRAFT_6505 [Tothia fuscella]